MRTPSKPSGPWEVFCHVLPVTLGYAVEFYDYGAYATLTNEVESQFFSDMPADSRSNLVWVIFALGQVARPVGGVVLGSMADKYGRRPTIIFSTVGMLLGTCAIGLLPTQHCCGPSWGVAGVVLLCLCRMLQGVCAAGEVASVNTWTVETVAPHRVGWAIGLCCAAAEVGFLVASAVADLVEQTMDEEALLAWGWRVPFLLSLPLGLLVLALQHRAVGESSEFEQTSLLRRGTEGGGADLMRPASKAASEAPAEGSGGLAWLWTEHRVPTLLAICLLAQWGAMGYGAVIYVKDFLTHINRRTVSEASALATSTYAFAFFFDLLAGRASDAFGIVRTATVAILACALLALPAWVLLVSEGDLSLPYVGSALMAALWCLAKVPLIATAVGLFPTAVRATAVGLSMNMAQLCFAAPAPVINNVMWEALAAAHRGRGRRGWIFLDSVSPAIWLYVGVLASAVALVGVSCAVRRRTLRTVSYLREERFFEMCD